MCPPTASFGTAPPSDQKKSKIYICVENYFFRVTDDEESVLCSGTYLSGSWDSNPCWLCDENVVPEWVEGCVEAGAESRFVGYRVDHAKVRWVAS